MQHATSVRIVERGNGDLHEFGIVFLQHFLLSVFVAGLDERAESSLQSKHRIFIITILITRFTVPKCRALAIHAIFTLYDVQYSRYFFVCTRLHSTGNNQKQKLFYSNAP